MNKTVIYEVAVMFADCDPAGIVFFANFNKWMDASSLNFFVQCGIPPWRELVITEGIIGTPLLEIHTKFSVSATYGERLQIHTSIEAWGRKTITQRHVIKRGDTLICEGTEVRALCIKHPDDASRLQAIAIPQWFKARCT
jgi:4-hydroxybenzoyl-CoA thioesterase